MASNAITKRTQRASLPVTAGDLIFIRPQPSDRAGQLIAETTDGPFCHVQVAISSTQVVEAIEHGVVQSFIQVPPNPADVASIGRGLDGARLAHARTWLLAQVDRAQYSGWDIAADVLLTFLPKRFGSRTPFLVAPSQMDCADLAVRFAVLAGYMWLPDALAMTPETSSPNAVARAVGVLK
jgi:hypothetical protein